MNPPNLTPQQRERILRAATSAPSKHNTQPWWFRWDGDDLEVHADVARALPFGDPEMREVHIACGAAAFAARLGYASLGTGTDVALLPDDADPHLMVRLSVTDAVPDVRFETLYWSLPSRRTTRAPFRGTPVPPQVVGELCEAAADEQAALRLVASEAADYGQLLDLVREAADLEVWQMSRRAVDAATPATSAETPSAVPAEPGQTAAAAERPPLIATLATPTDTPRDWLVAGLALQRVLVTGVRYGATASFTARPFVPAPPSVELPADGSDGGVVQVVLRCGVGRVLPATPRRDLADVLTPSGSGAGPAGRCATSR
ncbi:hypothetical protein [Yinghuangia seranimata]|uniref:hypothetical protein n=1 Tax=Yinghuangia seranimata TaxID=408067 RepID=UPI00248BF4B4|nr:hypothetical protein [Yinghuangia seranimata]MDI2124766.1 hypothetical protein [Yinghuangia seranimata]